MIQSWPKTQVTVNLQEDKHSGRINSFSDFCKSLNWTEHKLAFKNWAHWMSKNALREQSENKFKDKQTNPPTMQKQTHTWPQYRFFSKTYFIIRLLRSWSSPSRNSYLLVRDSEISVFASWLSVLSLFGSLGSTAPSPVRKHLLLPFANFPKIQCMKQEPRKITVCNQKY